MFIDTRQFPGPTLDVDRSFPRPPMEGTLGQGEGVRLTARATRTRDGIRLEGQVDTQVSLACARCNGTFQHVVESEFILMYTSQEKVAPAGEEVILTPEDCALAALDTEGRIDLIALTREQVYLSLPLKPICREACKGLCARCGADLNVETCDCGGPEPDPRLAVLASLKRRP